MITIANRTRNKQIVIRTTEKEYEQIKKRVERSKMTQNEFIIKCLTKTPINVLNGLPEAIKELKSIGNNLNQLTRAVHQGKTNSKEEVEKLNEEVQNLWQLLKSLKVEKV